MRRSSDSSGSRSRKSVEISQVLFAAILLFHPALFAQQSPTHRSSNSRSVFPLLTGSRWTYSFTQTIEGNKIYTLHGRYTDTIFAVDVDKANPYLQTVAVERDGTQPDDFGSCPASAPKDISKFWYVVDGSLVFLRCTRSEADDLASTLRAIPPEHPSVTDPEYVLPLSVGASWARTPTNRSKTMACINGTSNPPPH